MTADSLQRLADLGAVDVRILRDAGAHVFRVLAFGPDAGHSSWVESAAGPNAAAALAALVRTVESTQNPAIWPPIHWPECHHHHHHVKGVTVSVTLSDLAPGSKVTLTAIAREGDNVTVDPNAVITWTGDNAAVATVIDNLDGTALVTAVADGTANVTATATDPDGNVVKSDPEVITVVPPSTDAKSVIITPGVPF